MNTKFGLFLAVVISCSAAAIDQGDDPARKLGVFLGKWKTEAALAGSNDKITSNLECRWSPQGAYLVCEQLIKMDGGDHRQLTVYSYNAKDATYSYTTISDPGARPTSGTVRINGYVWVYDSSSEANGKTTRIRTTNEFSNPVTGSFKVESSDDGGATWRNVMQGTAHKTGQ